MMNEHLDRFIWHRFNNKFVVLIFIVVLMLFFCDRSSHAFEVEGFRSGMSLGEALKIAHKYDSTAKPVQFEESELTFIDFIETGKISKEWQLAFCNDVLVELKKRYSFSVPAATEIVSQLNERYGNGAVVHTEKIAGGNMSFFKIDFSWEDQLESISVSMASFAYKETTRDDLQKDIEKRRVETELDEWYELKKSCMH